MKTTGRTVRFAFLFTAGLALAGAALWVVRHMQKPPPPQGARTVREALEAILPRVEPRLREKFSVKFPPAEVLLLAFKREKALAVCVPGAGGRWEIARVYPILAASGEEGPKLREGDRQVPEGFYRVELLNPNSRYHLSLRIDYPSPADLERAAMEGRDRKTLGGDIMIHGKAVSAGCLAIGDPAVEEIFALAAAVGLDNLRVVIVPCDLRKSTANPGSGAPPWTADLHRELKSFLDSSLAGEP